MKNADFSIKIPFWKIIHFGSGKKIGESKTACFKSFIHIDRYGNVIGKSDRNFIGELNHYNNRGRCTGYSRQSGVGKITHFSNHGFITGKTYFVFGILLIHSDIVCYNGKKGADNIMFQDKFDDIIGCIEYLVDNGEEDIPQVLATETGLNLRLLGDAFQFITDMTLIKYIRQRRLVYALRNKLQKNLSVEDVAAATMFCDAAAFTKACKNEFNLTPGQITEEVLDKYPPLHFNRIISGSNADQMENDTLFVPNNDTNQGASSEQFAAIKRVLEISAVYGFDDDDAEFVYQLATEFNISIEEAAEFCEEARIQEKFDLTDHETQQLLYEIRNNGYAHLHELPKGFFDVYFSEENDRHGWFVPCICEIAEALDRNEMCADDLDQIVLHADTFGVDIVEAIEYFDEYDDSWNNMIDDALANGIPEDDTDGFGYKSIWEFDEK